ncbi:MAG: secondary thiamine-phosphate synthase enzyme YjbQ [Pseudomonadota bacterium]
MAHQKILHLRPDGAGLHEFTDQARGFVSSAGLDRGPALLTIFVRHTSCSLLIQENADPDVQRDLFAFFKRLVPSADDPAMAYLVHRAEGPDDMPAHIKSALTQTSVGVPVRDGQLLLGTWQGHYLFEHRTTPPMRQIVLHLS